MTNLDEVYKKLTAAEAEIQKSVGEKNALKKQQAKYESDLEELEQKCKKTYGCSLSELTEKRNEMLEKIQQLSSEIEEEIKIFNV